MSTTVNTMKLVTRTNELYLNQQEHKLYKDIELFGYGYLDWGRVINQSLITLMDKIDTLEDNGSTDLQFDLDSYEEEQKLLRTQEFKTWKDNFKIVINELMDTFKSGIDITISDFINAQVQITNGLKEEFQSLSSTIHEEISIINTGLDNKILDVINLQLKSITKTFNDAIESLTQSLNEVEQAKSELNQIQQQLSNNIQQFKQEFVNSFTVFKEQTESTLEENRLSIVKYIDDKLYGVDTTVSDIDDRIIKLENKTKFVTETYINEKIRENTEQLVNSVISNYQNTTNTKLNEIITAINSITLNIDEIVEQKVDSKIQMVNQQVNVVSNSLTQLQSSLNTRFTTIEESVSESTDLVTSIKNGIHQNLENFIEDIETYSKNIVSLETVKNSIIEKSHQLYENLIKQEDINIRNIIKYIDSERNSLLNAVRNSSFNELSLLKLQTERENLLNQKLSVVEYSSFQTDDGFGIYDLAAIKADNVIKYLIYTLKIPKNLLSEYTYGYHKFNITGKNFIRYVGDEGGPFPVAPLFCVPKFTETLQDIDELCGLENWELDQNIKHSALSQAGYDNILGATSTILLGINAYKQDLFLLDTDTITISVSNKTGTNLKEISFKLEDLFDKTKQNYILNLQRKTNSYSAEIQNLITNKTLTIPDFSLTKYSTLNNVSIPVCEIVKTTGNSELYLKVNLPINSTLNKIEYSKDGSSNIVLNATNINKFDLSLQNISVSSITYFKDICTTGVHRMSLGDNTTKKVTGTVYYTIGSTQYTQTFTSQGKGGGLSIEKVQRSINNDTYYEIDTWSYWSNVDAKNIILDVKVYDTTVGSETKDMWITANNVTTIAIRLNRYIRIYNDSGSNATFYITLTNPE